MNLEYANPWAIWLLAAPLLPLVISLFKPSDSKSGQPPSLYHPQAKTLHMIQEKLAIRNPAAKRNIISLRMLMWLLAWAFLVLAAMGPQTTENHAKVKGEGVDIVFVVDLSRSMLALDLSVDWRNPDLRVTRLGRAQEVMTDFIAKRMKSPGDRFGLVLFGEQAYVQSPLTSDGSAVASLINSAAVGLAGDATAIGDALTLGVKTLKDSKSKSKVMILLTDGDNTAGSVSPVDAARLVKQYGIKFYAVGIGRQDNVPFPEPSLFGMTIVSARMPVDLDALKKVADIAGGKFFHATTSSELGKIYDEINGMEKTETESRVLVTHTPLYRLPLLAGMIMLLLLWFSGARGWLHE